MKMNNEKENRQDQDIPSAIPAPTTLVKDDSVLPNTYPGSGLYKSPARMMKIEEVVEWDMEYGVKFGPVGYDHRLTCPYCRRRMLLVSHEGSRHHKTIRILYQCESCSAHTVVQFHGPNQDVELPELNLGEKIVIENPAPLPRPRTEEPRPVRQPRASGSSNRRQTQRNDGRSNQRNEQAQKTQTRNQKTRNRPAQRKARPKTNQNLQTRKTPTKPVVTTTPGKHPAVRLPGETIKKLQKKSDNRSDNRGDNKSSIKKPAAEKSNAYFRSRRRPKNNPK